MRGILVGDGSCGRLSGGNSAPDAIRASSRSPLRRSLANAVWNMAGSISPFAAGVFAIPVLIRRLGTDRFGVLTLAWALIGYLSLFDFGLGRAITKFVAERLSTKRSHEIPNIFWNAAWALMCFGSLGASFVLLAAPFISTHFLRVPWAIQPEVIRTLRIIAVTVPIVTVSTGLRAVVEGQQRFGVISVIRAGTGVLGFVAPVLVVKASPRLDTVVWSIAIVRVLQCLALWIVASTSFPELRRPLLFTKSTLKQLLGYGGWVTISSILSPLMVYMDRFAIGALVSVSAVAYYVTPHEIVTKLLIVPIALQAAVFPAFSGLIATRDARAGAMYQRAIELTLIVLLPISAAVIMFAEPALRIWLGPAFGGRSAHVAQILALGLVVNGVGHIPAALIQGSGRPDICAKLHLIEFPCYGVVCWYSITRYGIDGAAWAWVFRVCVDTGLLMYMARLVAQGWPWCKPVSALAALALMFAFLAVSLRVPLPASLSLFGVMLLVITFTVRNRMSARLRS